MIKSSDFKPTNGEAGYCKLDQVKYGGMESCTPGPDIDFTPIGETRDSTFWASLIGNTINVVSGVGNIAGPYAAAATQAINAGYNAIAEKYRADKEQDVLNSKLQDIVNQVNMKINSEIIRVKECLKSFVLEEIEEELHAEITDYLQILASNNNISDEIVAEDRWDDFIKDTNGGLIDFGSTWFSNYDNLDEIPFYYRIRLSDFDYYNNVFSSVFGYFTLKQAYCNNPNRTHSTGEMSCRVLHNLYLTRARDLIEDMNIWVIKALKKIRDDIYSYPILSKDFDASGDFILHRNKKTAGDSVNNYRLDRLDFGQDFYGEAKTRVLDLDDGKGNNNGKDILTVWIRMNSEYDQDENKDINKICQLPNTLECDIRIDRIGTGPRRENLEQSCKDALTEAAINKREEFRNEIDTYWYNLITKYLAPMQSRIDSLYTFPLLNPSSGIRNTISRSAQDQARAHSLLYALTTEGTFRFERGSGCLTVDPSNNNIHFSGCNGKSNQIWRLGEIDNNGYALIISKFNNLCLFADYETEDDNIYTTQCDENNDDQGWKITGDSVINGAKRSGYQNCLDADRDASDDNVRAVRCNENDQNQQIIFSRESIIKAIFTNQCVKVESEKSDNVVRGDCNGNFNEKWRLGNIDNDGFYTLISLFNNKCLHVTPDGNPVFQDNRDNIVNIGDRVISSTCNGNNNQRWKIDGNMIINKENYCLDVNHDTAIDVLVWNCQQDNDNQMIVLPGFLSLLL